MAHIYGNGTTTTTIGSNINTVYHHRKAIIDLKKEQFFGQLADVTHMPRHTWAA